VDGKGGCPADEVDGYICRFAGGKWSVRAEIQALEAEVFHGALYLLAVAGEVCLSAITQPFEMALFHNYSILRRKHLSFSISRFVPWSSCDNHFQI
jgi:hypothetical protein